MGSLRDVRDSAPPVLQSAGEGKYHSTPTMQSHEPDVSGITPQACGSSIILPSTTNW